MESRLLQLLVGPIILLSIAHNVESYGKELPSIRVDCLHFFADESDSQGTQPCLNVSGLKIQFIEESESDVSTSLSFDPFGSASRSRSHLPTGVWRPSIGETPLKVIDEYSLTWRPRNNFNINVGSHGGVAVIPSHSGLSMAQSLVNNGWDQTALSLSYNLSTLDGMQVSFAFGNGEGENGSNLDPQQYLGFQSQLAVIPGVVAWIGLSQDGNNAGSYATRWQLENAGEGCESSPKMGTAYKGYSTQRKSVALEIMEGVLLPGLTVVGGMHAVTRSDLDKDQTLYPDYRAMNCKRVKPDLVFLEDSNLNIANRMQHLTGTFNFSYQFFERWFLGLDYGRRTIDTGDIHYFSTCESIKDMQCRGNSKMLRKIGESTIAVGGGVELDDELLLTAEYSRQSYDELYNYAWFLDSGNASTSRDIFNVRISWRWNTM